MQASAGARKYAESRFLGHLIEAAIEEFPHIPVCMHQDHGVPPNVCQQLIQLGFSSVMMDGSLLSDQKTPASYDYNADVIALTTRMAHACGVSVEGEPGCLGSLESSMLKLKKGEDLDLAAEDLRLARSDLDEVVGIKTADSLLGDIFNDFCIGK